MFAMAERKFKFVSPGIFLDEIDNSALTALPEDIGPVVIGRSEKGPGMRPVKVDSFSDFVELFGSPNPGGGSDGDVWRNNAPLGPTYAVYAAQAWLKNNSPLTFVRLLGEQHPQKTSDIGAKAGWTTSNANFNKAEASNGGAYALFLIDSASLGDGGHYPTGTLAAVWYLESGSIALTGTVVAGHGDATGSTYDTIPSLGSTTSASLGGLYKNAASNTWTVELSDSSVTTKYSFNFDRDSSKFIRRVFNTSPAATNPIITNTTSKYWLGETFEGQVKRYVGSGSSAGTVFGTIMALGNDSYQHQDQNIATRPSKTGWFISQDVRENYASFTPDGTTYVKNLFRFCSLDDGEWAQNNVKISIMDIKAPRNKFEKYGSFTVVLRDIRDKDNAPIILEKFANLNLNPDSENYIAKRIGDKILTWDNTKKLYKETGDYNNVSKIIRVVIDEDIKNGGADPELLPFGVRGHLRYKGFKIEGRNLKLKHYTESGVGDAWGANLFLETGPDTVPKTHGEKGIMCWTGSATAGQNPIATGSIPVNNAQSYTGSFLFPTVPLRASSRSGSLVRPKDAFFGADFNRLEEPSPSTLFEESCLDIVRALPEGVCTNGHDPNGTVTEHAWVFSLDDLSGSMITSTGNPDVAIYTSGSRAAGTSYTAVSGTYKQVLDNGFNRFTAVLYGGHNGLNITEAEPFGNHILDNQNRDEKKNYAYHSVKRAIDAVADAEAIEMDLLAVPGVTDSSLTDHMVNICEDRADALAIIDIANDFTPRYESLSSESSRIGTVSTAVSSFKDRGLNSSYGCAFYPWVQVRDTASESHPGKLVWVPPSVVALGVFSNTQKSAELWFAPAGFNRGGLSGGSAGIPVTNVRQRLTVDDRDDLYEANINPIASFPSEGIVIFGQKTLQITQSALDRINVRRLLIFVKKQISRIAATILFEPNVQATWDRFLSQVNPFLEGIKSRFGLSDFRVVLDKTTTSDDLVDRNILYAKVFLKPTKAIEFIALDFLITNTGASFED
tara:strand:- start:18950 stop:21979 length:3030 start_codon:yes stop_codon:yes gene_type:complete